MNRNRSGNESVESCEDLSALPGIGMRTATIAVIEKQPSIEAPNNSEEVVSTISGVIVKQVSPLGCIYNLGRPIVR